MRTASWATLAACIGLTAGFVAGSMAGIALHLDVKFDERKRPEDTVLVLVAARDLRAGQVVTERDLYAVQVPPRYVPAHTLVDVDRALGRTVTEDVLANELLREERLR